MRIIQLISCFLGLPVCLLAQAWLSPKGEGAVSVLYQYGFDRLHVFSDGRTRDRGHIFLDGVIVDSDFSLTERLAVRLSLPYLSGKYVGPYGHTVIRGRPDTAVALDNGSFHGALQDFRVDVRYSLSKHALKLAPFFEANIPSHDYPTLGHAAIGINMREYRIGVNVGRRLDPILPKAFVQGRYALGFSQTVANIAPKRSYAESQLGYFLTPRLSLQGSAVWTHSHNGIDHDYDLFPNNLTEEQWLNHDRISRVELLDLGVNAGYSFSRSTSVTVGVGRSLWGANTHFRTVVLSIGFVKAFGTRLAAENSGGAAKLPETRKALVCTCAKSK